MSDWRHMPKDHRSYDPLSQRLDARESPYKTHPIKERIAEVQRDLNDFMGKGVAHDKKTVKVCDDIHKKLHELRDYIGKKKTVVHSEGVNLLAEVLIAKNILKAAKENFKPKK